MSTLEDRLLGYKKQYYFSDSSSSNSESDDDDDDNDVTKVGGVNDVVDTNLVPAMPPSSENSAVNTGPKGVIKDWQRYKQLQSEKRAEQREELVQLAKRLTLTCRSDLSESQRGDQEKNNLEDELVLRQYIIKRMEEMEASHNLRPQFGMLMKLDNSASFLEAVDKEDKRVTVIVHIYRESLPACRAMNGCLISLASEYRHVKFCTLHANDAGISQKFKIDGLPALLVYKDGHLVGNFVCLAEELGDDFYATDVDNFLIEHGIIQDKSLVPPLCKPAVINSTQDDSSDSDLSIDE